MYFTFLGGSALLHLLAAHPKVVAAVGIATTVTLLVSPTGPANYLGASQHVRGVERAVDSGNLLGEAEIPTRSQTAAQLRTMSRDEIERSVRHMLSQCGKGCADLTPAIVMNDRELLENVVYVSEVESSISNNQRARMLNFLSNTSARR